MFYKSSTTEFLEYVEKLEAYCDHLEVKENDFIDGVSVDHECKFYINANWTYLKCSCGNRKKPSEP